jgi:hypothetical protein
MRRMGAVLSGGLVLVWLAASIHAEELRFSVTYRSSGGVYIDGGRLAGLQVGDRLKVVASGAMVAELEVVFVADRSASCRVVQESRAVEVGDVAVIEKERPTEPEEITVAPSAPAVQAVTPVLSTGQQPGERPWARVAGSVSVGWGRSFDRTESAYDFEQRYLRLNLSARDLGGRPFRFDVRLRSRQDLRHWTPAVEDVPRQERRDRLYALSLSYDPPEGRARFAVGRLGSGPVAIGFLDGALGELRVAGPLRVGGFFGTRSEVQGGDLDEPGLKYGGFLSLRPGAGGAWDAVAVGVRETAGDSVSREYVGFQGRYASGAFATWQWLELDLNRDWREAASEQAVQLSNLSVAGSYRFSPSASVALSYDRHRNFRTAETRSIPEELFDHLLRQGLRASLDVTSRSGLGVSGFFGVRQREEQADGAYSYGGSLRHGNLFGSRVTLSLDGAGFSNGTTTGLQGRAYLGRSFASAHAALAYGLTRYSIDGTIEPTRLNQYLRFSLRLELPKRFWLLGEVEEGRGDDLDGLRVDVALGYRF